MSARGRVHLLCGPTGSGKTTFARKLAANGAVHLCLDRWMIRLFGQELERPEFDRKLAACFELFTELAGSIAERGVPVVFDAGFWHKRLRVETRARLAARGVETVLYRCELPDAQRWARLEHRNRALAGSDSDYLITREMFEAFLGCYEPPQADEDPQDPE
jgi:predicted kinase